MVFQNYSQEVLVRLLITSKVIKCCDVKIGEGEGEGRTE